MWKICKSITVRGDKSDGAASRRPIPRLILVVIAHRTGAMHPPSRLSEARISIRRSPFCISLCNLSFPLSLINIHILRQLCRLITESDFPRDFWLRISLSGPMPHALCSDSCKFSDTAQTNNTGIRSYTRWPVSVERDFIGNLVRQLSVYTVQRTRCSKAGIKFRGGDIFFSFPFRNCRSQR